MGEHNVRAVELRSSSEEENDGLMGVVVKNFSGIEQKLMELNVVCGSQCWCHYKKGLRVLGSFLEVRTREREVHTSSKAIEIIASVSVCCDWVVIVSLRHGTLSSNGWRRIWSSKFDSYHPSDAGSFISGTTCCNLIKIA